MECNNDVVAKVKGAQSPIVYSRVTKEGIINKIFKKYKHSPPHYFEGGQVYMITGATYKKNPYFCMDSDKGYLTDLIGNRFTKNGWELKAWVVLNNHYHILTLAPNDVIYLPKMINEIHKFSAIKVNKRDNVKGRKVWWNYWDRCVTYESSYYARWNYIHFNPVKHGYVSDPKNWQFSSYSEFWNNNPEDTRSIEEMYPFDRVNVKDDF